MTVDEQMASLRRLGNSRVVHGLAAGLAGVAVLLVAIGLLMGWVAMFALAAFAGFIAFAAKTSTPHLRRAARALDAGRRAHVPIEIEVRHAGDSPSYRAVVTSAPGQTWRVDFVPHGWTPDSGTYVAEARFLADVPWPVLLITDDGLLVPRHAPRRLSSS
jgi:uncharacterized membrane protein YedE/YeeE